MSGYCLLLFKYCSWPLIPSTGWAVARLAYGEPWPTFSVASESTGRPAIHSSISSDSQTLRTGPISLGRGNSIRGSCRYREIVCRCRPVIRQTSLIPSARRMPDPPPDQKKERCTRCTTVNDGNAASVSLLCAASAACLGPLFLDPGRHSVTRAQVSSYRKDSDRQQHKGPACDRGEFAESYADSPCCAERRRLATPARQLQKPQRICRETQV